MAMNLQAYKSKLAKRFFGMFVAGALIPILALAVVSYYRVTQQLTDQALDRLRQSSKSHALSIYEHLLMADHQLQILQTILPDGRGTRNIKAQHSDIIQLSREFFTSMALFRNGEVVSYWGDDFSTVFRKAVLNMSLAKDPIRLVSVDHGGKWPTIVIVRMVENSEHRKEYLLGAIDPSFLWGLKTGTILPPAVEFSVFDDQGRSLFCSLGTPLAMIQNHVGGDIGSSGRKAELEIHQVPYYAFSWSAFLKPHFHVPYWTVLVMEPRDHVLQPLRSFRSVFLSIVAMSFLIVVFLTSRAIRRSLVPIDALMHGARQVASGLFSHRVDVQSKDEFQDLAVAFNSMTHELDSQFKAMSARSDLDRAVLSVLDVDQIVSTSLNHSGSFIPSSVAAMSILDKEEPLRGHSYIRQGKDLSSDLGIEPFQLHPEEHALLLENRNWLRVDADKLTFSYLQALNCPAVDHFIVFPVWVQNRLFALISLGVTGKVKYGSKDLEQMRGFADHLAIAFANSDLLTELKELNVGTLYALARTVDAKSSWTAGHSVRVAQLAVEIAEALELPQEKLDDLQRGALLHDIGKIGIPVSILDKPGKLTAEERKIIETHPSIGARILSPIRAYAGIIPLVEQHHERYDGGGYPSRRKGDEIHPAARIMALADAFDAMVSNRPYRPGLTQEQAVEVIQREAGYQFDPRVVEAFTQVIGRRKSGVFSEPLSESYESVAEMVSSSSTPGMKNSSNSSGEWK